MKERLIITVVASCLMLSSHLNSVEPPKPAGLPFVNTLGMKFMPVAGTRVLFSIWDTRVRDYAEFAKEAKVDGAWQSQAYIGMPVSREPDCPVAGVTRNDANAFCRWLTEKEISSGKIPNRAVYRLPTDSEWSRAVGLEVENGATPKERAGKDQDHFPWGMGFPPPKNNVGNYADEFMKKTQSGLTRFLAGYSDGFPSTSPVGAYEPNRFGLYDMGGNVWQWVSDPFDTGSDKGTLRGGDFEACEPGWLRSSSRASNPPDTVRPYYGFRCVLTMAEPKREVAVATPKPVDPLPPPATPPPPPSVAMGPSAPGAPGENRKMTPMVGGQSGKDFAETQPEGGILVGLEVWKGTYYRDLVIAAVRGIYKTDRGVVRGAIYGRANGSPDVTFESQAGLAINRIEAVDDREQVVAMRVGFQSGESPWIGRDVPKTLVPRKMPRNLQRRTISTGQPAHGICGGVEGTLFRLGLIF